MIPEPLSSLKLGAWSLLIRDQSRASAGSVSILVLSCFRYLIFQATYLIPELWNKTLARPRHNSLTAQGSVASCQCILAIDLLIKELECSIN